MLTGLCGKSWRQKYLPSDGHYTVRVLEPRIERRARAIETAVTLLFFIFIMLFPSSIGNHFRPRVGSTFHAEITRIVFEFFEFLERERDKGLTHCEQVSILTSLVSSYCKSDGCSLLSLLGKLLRLFSSLSRVDFFVGALSISSRDISGNFYSLPDVVVSHKVAKSKTVLKMMDTRNSI